MTASDRMIRATLLLAVLALALLACGPVRRINPPAVSVQEMTAPESGPWQIALRVENFSNVPMQFVAISFEFELDGQPAGRVEAKPDMLIPGESAERVEVTLNPAAAARTALLEMSSGRRPNLAYVLRGSVRTEEPNEEFDVEHSSRLSPVPGLVGVYR